MALPLLYRLGLSARRAYPAVVGGVRSGLSRDAIGASVRKAGIQISNESLGAIMREERAAIAHGKNLRNVNFNSKINTSKLPFASTTLRERFSYSVNVRGFDANGNFVDRFTTVTTNDPNRTRADIEDAARNSVSFEGQSDTLDEVEVVISEGRQRIPVGI